MSNHTPRHTPATHCGRVGRVFKRKNMMKTPLLLAVALLTLTGIAASAETTSDIFESPTPPTTSTEIDRIVLAKLASMDIKPVRCSDSVFVRRAFLDVIGTLPTADEARKFIKDPAEGKRHALIDSLMERDEFADYWSMRWGDVLRIKAEFPINLWPNGAQAYHRWVRASIVENKPYDRFARELLTSSGSNFRVGPVNFYRAIQNKTPDGIATAVALALMGARAESWPEDRLPGMAVFFSQIGYKPTSEWKEENVFWDPLHVAAVAGNVAPGQAAVDPVLHLAASEEKEPAVPPVEPGPLAAVFPDGTKIQLAPNQDPREIFADWLITPDNPCFASAIVNRVWAWIMGRGIIHEPDDIRDDNPPSDPELMSYLEKELVESKYDLRHIYRLILTSDAYQFSSVPHFSGPEAAANFASYPLRRLDAEILIDAVNQITGTTDLYTSAIPEPFTYIPKDQPAMAVADGSITSPFLALFGRSARATGMENERNSKLVPAQWLHMLNSSHIQAKLERGPKLRALFRSGRKGDKILEELYLTILSRFPTPQESKTVAAYVKSTESKGQAVVDIAWSLINSTEFLHRH